jgi:protein-S-isoprenylcysteine O-methyltransferase Ste14
MQPDVHGYIGAAWLVVGIVWLVGAFTTKKTVRAQPGRNRVVYVTLVLLGALLFQKSLQFGFLALRFVPMSAATAYTGLTLTIAGVAFTIWARFYLGSNWSGRPTIKEGHTLIRSGPYAVVRHPIYSGISLGLLGTAIAQGKLGSLIGTVLILIAFKVKSRLEEAFMMEQFGAAYVRYKEQVKGLIPFVW